MFSRKNIRDIPEERTPHNSGTRKVLATKEEVNSKCLEAFTQGFLPAKEKWAMHKHE